MKISNIRSQFASEYQKLKKVEEMEGSKNGFMPSLWCFNKLLFLKGHISSRKSSDYFISCEEIEESREGCASEEDVVPSYTVLYNDEEETILPDLPAECQIKLNASSVQHVLPTKQKKKKKEKPPYFRSTQNDCGMALGVTAEKLTNNEKNVAFANFVAESMDNIKSKVLRMKLRHEIMQKIMEYELQDNAIINN